MGHKNNLIAVFVVFALLAACGDLWAQGIARQVANDLEKIESYRGETVEHGIAGGEVKRKVLFSKPWKFRVETVSPVEHAGELFLFDGQRVVYWWPKAGFGIEVVGAAVPSRKEIRAHIGRITDDALSSYAFSLRSERRRVAGQRAVEWQVIPTRKKPFRFEHRSWNHAKYGLPLKMRFPGAKGKSWYEMEFSSIEFGVAVAEDAFDFKFPDNAVVFRWDLRGEGITMARARELMNFTVRVPGRLPPGHKIDKIFKPEHALPMLSIVMDRGASKLSLTQSRNFGSSVKPLGKEITIGKRRGTLSFLGPFTSITWVVDDALLTLSGNLSFPEMISIAESVQ